MSVQKGGKLKKYKQVMSNVCNINNNIRSLYRGIFCQIFRFYYVIFTYLTTLVVIWMQNVYIENEFLKFYV